MKFVDIQVNGAFGVDFNDDNLNLEQFSFVCKQLSSCGVEYFLPTLITAPMESMCHRIGKISKWVRESSDLRKIVAGIHVEGPFLSPRSGFLGTHPVDSILPATVSSAQQLVGAGEGLVRLLTLAPECDQDALVTNWLTQHDIVVFAGHTDASIDELQQGIDHGLRGFTHLGNGCAMEVSRHDNIINRVLACRKQLVISAIADSVHIPFWLLRSWLEIFGEDQLIVTSDSMSAAGMPAGEYVISGQPIVVDEQRRTTHRDHKYLAGSASTLQDMSDLSAAWAGQSTAVKEKVFSTNARRLFQLER